VAVAASVAAVYQADVVVGNNEVVTATYLGRRTTAKQGFRAGIGVPEAVAVVVADGDDSDVPAWEHPRCAIREELADLGEDRRQP